MSSCDTSGLVGGTPPISNELYQSVREQITRKLMTYLPGIPIDPSIAVALYANSFDGIQRIQQSHTNADGSDNRNPQNHGNTYEEQEVTAFNREAILNGSTLRAERTDNLADMQRVKGEAGAYAVKHHMHTDIIVTDTRTGKVVETMQVKHTRGSNILAKEAYTTSADAPDTILVPSDMKGRHSEKLESISAHAHSEDNRHRADVARKKLQGGRVDSKFTERPDKDNYPLLNQLCKNNPELAKKIPYLHQGGIACADAVTRVGGRLAVEGGTIILGGVLYEIRDAWQNPRSMTLKDRAKRFFTTIFNVLKLLFKSSGPKELALELLNGILGLVMGLFKNAAKLVTTFASALHQIWSPIWDFITGKIRSFSELVSIVLKVLSATGIATCAIALEQYISAHVPWIPSILVGLLCAALGGIAMVYANRAIEAAVSTFVGAISEAKAARLHREQVEQYIYMTLPGLLKDSEKLDRYARVYIRNQETLINKTYPEIARAFGDATCSAQEFADKISDAQEKLGMARLPDNYISALDAKLLADADRMHGRVK